MPEHVVVLGGGPAGLYSATLLRRARPWLAVTVLARNGAGGGGDTDGTDASTDISGR